MFKNDLILIVKNFCKNTSTGLAIDLSGYNMVSTEMVSTERSVFWSLLKHTILELQSSLVHSFNADVLTLKSYKSKY